MGSGSRAATINFQKDNDLLVSGNLNDETKKILLQDPRQSQVDNLRISFLDEEDIVIHCFVALCCNLCQGIVPVPEFLGKGDDLDGNLYWGAQGGLRTFFNRNQDWSRINQYAVNDTILERIVYHRKVQTSDVYLVADAYHGKYIDIAIDNFLQSTAGNNIIEIKLENKTIQAGGKSRLLAYIGHDGLMDRQYFKEIEKAADSGLKETIILACLSERLFNYHIERTGAYPLLWTSGLMAPEAYTLEAAIEGWVNLESSYEIRLRAAKAYDKYQHCGLDAAVNLLLSGW